jgi:hypothetical protein
MATSAKSSYRSNARALRTTLVSARSRRETRAAWQSRPRHRFACP